MEASLSSSSARSWKATLVEKAVENAVASVALLALLGLSGCFKIDSSVNGFFANGEKTIQRALQAKAQAKSFKMTTKIAVHDGNMMETDFYMQCPDRQRITLKIASLKREMIRIGQRFYLNEDGTWYYKDVDVTDWSPCGLNAGLASPWALLTEGRDMLAVFASTKEKLKVQTAKAIEYNGKKYDTWTVSRSNGTGGSLFNYTMLLDDDQRPVVIVAGQTIVTEYFDWDQPITIEAPANALPYPENTEQIGPAAYSP